MPETSAVELLRNADLAMYHAKADGRHRYAIFEDHLHAELEERLRLETDLRAAIEQGQARRATTKPIIQLESQRIGGVEALVRWEHPERGLLAPGEFIDVAEESGLVVPLGWVVLEQACRDLASWRAAFADAAPRYVSVNMSARALKDSRCTTTIEEIVVRSGLAPSEVVLEVTESEMLHNGPTTRAVLAELRRLGFSHRAIDDFGTGLLLARLPHAVPPSTS